MFDVCQHQIYVPGPGHKRLSAWSLQKLRLQYELRKPSPVQVMSVKRSGRLPGMRGSETHIMPTSSASPPTERVY